ncbi:MAG: SRPBCC domain-containing protein [Rectinemataceae bacterium]
MDQIRLKAEFAVSAGEIYAAWLDPLLHGSMSSGGEAHIEAVVGGAFDCGDGYIRGKNLELDPGARILQSWRTTDFAEDQADTMLELTLEDSTSGCTLTLAHNGFPAGQVDEYRQGWEEYYLGPMKAYFG